MNCRWTIKSLVIIAVAFSLTGCSEGDNGSITDLLIGTWKSNCYPLNDRFGRYVLKETTFTIEEVFTRRELYYDAACQDYNQGIDIFGLYWVGKERQLDSGQIVTEIDFEIDLTDVSVTDKDILLMEDDRLYFGVSVGSGGRRSQVIDTAIFYQKVVSDLSPTVKSRQE